MEPLLVEPGDGLVIATLNRPEKRNALNPELWEALALAHEEFEADPVARVMILTGAPPVFCAGMDLLLTGRSIDAPTALARNLVNQVVPAAEVMPAAERMAAAIISASPLGVAAGLKIGRRAFDLPESELWRINAEEFAGITASADAMEGARAFIEKRPANWAGR